MHASLCVCVLCRHKIPHSTSNKIQQSPKVQLLLDEEPAGDLSEGLNGCASASAAQARALARVCTLCVVELTVDRLGRRWYQRQAVFTLIPRHYFLHHASSLSYHLSSLRLSWNPQSASLRLPKRQTGN